MLLQGEEHPDRHSSPLLAGCVRLDGHEHGRWDSCGYLGYVRVILLSLTYLRMRNSCLGSIETHERGVPMSMFSIAAVFVTGAGPVVAGTLTRRRPESIL